MDWEGREESSNVEDRRRIGPAGLAVGGGGLGILVMIVAVLLGFDPRQFLGPGGANPVAQNRPADPEEDKLEHFSAIVLKDTETVWNDQFRKMGKQYREPNLVTYTAEVRSGCGDADSSVGPFYCPVDEKVYIDLSFYRDMERKLNAPGDFAHAYVIAHEVGHHVQKLLGYSARAEKDKRSSNDRLAHQSSVRLELQADYFAGVWGHYAQERFHYLNKRDIDFALNAANQIGDDRLQRNAHRTVNPDTFTHGTSEQRSRWFKAGFDTGDIPGAARLFELRYEEL
jgi:predicted metalloprotease